MKTAILTGASGGIGDAVCRRLLALDYRVIGVSRTARIADEPNYRHVFLDLLDEDALHRFAKETIANEPSVDLLVHAAGKGLFGPHEELMFREMKKMLALDFEVPILLTGLFLRALKKSRGQILFITSEAGRKPSTYGCAYGAAKAGLAHFSESLFEEVRKTGVRVSSISPDMTDTGFFDDLSFGCAGENRAYLTADDTADAVEYLVTAPDRMCVQEIVLRPQVNRIERKPQRKPGDPAGEPDSGR